MSPKVIVFPAALGVDVAVQVPWLRAWNGLEIILLHGERKCRSKRKKSYKQNLG